MSPACGVFRTEDDKGYPKSENGQIRPRTADARRLPKSDGMSPGGGFSAPSDLVAGKRGGVAEAPPPRFTADGNADRLRGYRTFQYRKKQGLLITRFSLKGVANRINTVPAEVFGGVAGIIGREYGRKGE